MKNIAVCISFLAIFALSITSCKKPPEPVTPVDELLIGNWRSIDKKENGNSQPAAEGYTEMIFAVDTSDQQTVLISNFEQDGAEIDTTEDTWTLTESDTVIEFGGDEPALEIKTITTDTLIVLYNKVDPFSGNDVEHEDSYLKF